MKKEFFESFSDGELSTIHDVLSLYLERKTERNAEGIRSFNLNFGSPKLKDISDYIETEKPVGNEPVGNDQTRCSRCIRLIEINMVKRFKYKF